MSRLLLAGLFAFGITAASPGRADAHGALHEPYLGSTPAERKALSLKRWGMGLTITGIITTVIGSILLIQAATASCARFQGCLGEVLGRIGGIGFTSLGGLLLIPGIPLWVVGAHRLRQALATNGLRPGEHDPFLERQHRAGFGPPRRAAIFGYGLSF